MKSPSIARWAEEEVSWLKCVLLCTFSERWASKLSTTTQPTAKPPSATRRCLHCCRCWMAVLIFLGEGRISLFRTLHIGQAWSLGVRLSCSYETAGMWRELANRLLVWFPQDVAKKTELVSLRKG